MKFALKNEPVVVLDACALIAFFNNEPGADVVEEALATVATVEISSINLLEVAYDAVPAVRGPGGGQRGPQGRGILALTNPSLPRQRDD
jgi:uncharacterized protein with PIN domain